MDAEIRGAQSGPFTIPAGGRLPLGTQGQFIRCLNATDTFYVSINGGSEMFFAGGIQWKAEGLDYFTEIALINKSASPIDVIIAWGFGEYSDSRLSASGNLTVINAAGTKLDVDDADTQAALASLEVAVEDVEASADEIKAMMQHATDKRKALRSLSGASYSAVSNATTTIVTGAANVNGIHVIRAFVDGTVGNGYLTAGGNRILGATISGFGASEVEDVFIPAGQALAAYSSGGSNTVYTWYKVL